MSIFRCENVSRYFKTVATILDISLAVEQGELVSLLGSSGVGKTTLFNILAGVDTPDTGKVFLKEKDITGKAGSISYMLQKDTLLPYKTIEDNVSLPLVIKGESVETARKAAGEYFDFFGLAGYEKAYPSQLSGGMRQRASLLRTFFMDSPVMLLDEPFSALDTVTKKEMHSWYIDVITQLNRTTLFITHDIDEALLLSHRVYVMAGKPGKIATEITDLPPWPRDSSYLLTTEFMERKQHIIDVMS